MRTVLIFFLVFSTAAHAEQFRGYTLEEADAFHRLWTIDNWDEGGPLMRYVFLNMSEFWNHSVIDRGGPVRELPDARRDDVATFITRTGAGAMTLRDYVDASTVNGAVVVHRGNIVFEAYPRMLATDKHLHMSLSKPFASTLIAILEDRELIDVTKAVDSYLPELEGSGWDGVPIRDVLDMASGIGCLEGEDGAYTDPSTCYYQFEAALGWLRPAADSPDDPYAYTASMQSHRPAGEAFEYTSPDTFVLGWLVERITGRPLADVLATEIWQRIGAEADAVVAAPRRGIPLVHAGISSTLRDVVRFGLLFTPSGRGGLEPVVSDDYLDDIQHGGRPEIFRAARGEDAGFVDGEPARHNSYQWDLVMEDGDFFKGGYGGQGLYISPSRDLVVAYFATFDTDRDGHEMLHVARQLAKSGLFDPDQ